MKVEEEEPYEYLVEEEEFIESHQDEETDGEGTEAFDSEPQKDLYSCDLCPKTFGQLNSLKLK